MIINQLIADQCVFLRCLSPADASNEYLSWIRDPAVNVYLEVRFAPPNSVEDLRKFIDSLAQDPDHIFLGIFKLIDSKHIGNLKIGPINRSDRSAEVGFIIGDTSEWGKGYASRAIKLMSDYVFLSLGLEKLTAGCYEGNVGSRRALEKAGFKEESRQNLKYEVNGVRQDGLRFSKFNTRSQVS